MISQGRSKEPGGTFTITGGRSGLITYREGERLLEFDWEMSGDDKYTILLAPLSLDTWKQPRGQSLSDDEKTRILCLLRAWLRGIGHRTNIDSPESLEESAIECAWADCKNKALKEFAYCPTHFDFIVVGRYPRNETA